MAGPWPTSDLGVCVPGSGAGPTSRRSAVGGCLVASPAAWGLDEIGVRCVQYLRRNGLRVTCVDVAPSADHVAATRSSGAIVLRRDATSRTMLERAGVHRARHVVCACPDDATNTRIAATVALVAHAALRAEAPTVYVKVVDLDLMHGLQGRLATVGLTRLHFFNPAVLWSGLLLDNDNGPFERPGSPASKISVIGSSPLAQAIVVGAARRWHHAGRAAGLERRARITVVAPEAQRLIATLQRRYARLAA
ncbi:MAG: TrkA-N domain, partial [Pseudonocardiales bacterium]|nr:TrkA-N domain [Pseudonocardiales bacterium]